MPQSFHELNQAITSAEFPIRGEVVSRAEEISAALKMGKQFPFKEVVHLNSGDDHQFSKFSRDFLALCAAPHILDQPDEVLLNHFKRESIERARQFVRENPVGIGAYTHSKGYLSVRREVAEFIYRRDGFPSDPESIFLTNGSSAAITDVIKLLAGPQAYESALFAPYPQYPLYDPAINVNCSAVLKYELKEDEEWNASMEDIRQTYADFVAENPSVKVRAFIAINPSNPCGSVMSEEAESQIIEFCSANNLALLADEVHQSNVYGKPFVSFKKALRNFEQKTGLFGPMLVSFYSASKGIMGECGARGGYMEIANGHQYIVDQLYKLASVSLCANSVGYLTVSILVNPFKDQEYVNQYKQTLEDLQRKASIITRAFSDAPNMSCQPISGALYCFPKIALPNKFLIQCKVHKRQPDEQYCLKLLETTGICVIPGTGFGQRQGTSHFRMSLLETDEKLQSALERIIEFHKRFWEEWK